MSESKKSLTGGQAAIKSLKKEKVKHVFGLIGSATMEMFDALYHEKTIKFIGVRDERTGTHMADGYARASNNPGVIIAGQNGPGATNLVTGVAQTDYSGYPDCRQETIRATEESIKLGMEFDIKIHTPLMFKSKKQTVDMALELGALEAIGYSHTCYNGERPPCGTCQACNLRNKGFSEAGISDPLLAQFKEDGP